MRNVPNAEMVRDTSELELEPGYYRHFKGARYQLLCVAHHSETEEPLAVYRSLEKPNELWVRPAGMFAECVESPQGVVPRFQFEVHASPSLGRPRLARLRLILDRLGRMAASPAHQGHDWHDASRTRGDSPASLQSH